MDWINYHHLLYFSVVAREGSIAKACKILHLAQPTVSSQLQKLERSLGGKLFVRHGRNLRLTDLGRTVYRYADEIFSLGKELVDVAKGRPTGQPLKLSVGVCDAVPKLVVYQLLLPAITSSTPLRLVVREGAFDALLAELTSFELDIVLSDAPVGPGARVKAYNHLLGECDIVFFGTAALSRKLRNNFPQSLHGAPILLPAAHTPLRRTLDLWFEEQNLRPDIRGEFQDSALMKVFGQQGLGIFPVPRIIAGAVRQHYSVRVVGEVPQLRERFYAISVERRLKHPAVIEVSTSAKKHLFVEHPKSGQDDQ